MKYTLLFLFLFASSASAQVVSQNGAPANNNSVSYTATSYSSAPIVNVSTISAPGILGLYTGGGFFAAKFNADGTSRFNIGAFTDGTLGDMELIDTGSPDFYFRRNDTSVTAAEGLGCFYWDTNDSSTGGGAVKSNLCLAAAGTWGSGQTMEQTLSLSLSRGGGTPADYVVATTSGVLITSGAGFTAGTTISCATCTLQVVSPAGSGISVVGNIEVSSTVVVGGGSVIARITKTNTASTDLGGAITATCTAETNFSLTGVQVGDACIVTTPAALAATDWIVYRTLADISH